MEDGIGNIRYLLVDMTHGGYNGLINAFKALHRAKNAAQGNEDSGHELTVRPNLANTQAIVKVVGGETWMDDENSRLTGGLASNLILNIWGFEDLPSVKALLGSTEWAEES